MNFQIKALHETDFAHLFTLSNEALAENNACRQIVETKGGTPCRVSLQDAQVGETVILTHYEHQPENSPYKASHAIFVREGATEAKLAVNEVPEAIRVRLISLRYFDANHMMVEADVVAGHEVSQRLTTAFEDPKIEYVHLHNAKPGCFHASAHRAV